MILKLVSMAGRGVKIPINTDIKNSFLAILIQLTFIPVNRLAYLCRTIFFVETPEGFK